jgi:hypothetical protein
LRFFCDEERAVKKYAYRSSYECGRRLIELGCPLDFLEALPREAERRRISLKARQIEGYCEGRVISLGPYDTGYVFGLRLETEIWRGVVITGWSFTAPWGDHEVVWGEDRDKILPERDRVPYAQIGSRRFSAVLLDRHLLRRGYPEEGVFCGRAYRPLPESAPRGGIVCGAMKISDDTGRDVDLSVKLVVVHRKVRPPKKAVVGDSRIGFFGTETLET